jgi:hypothetical protein
MFHRLKSHDVPMPQGSAVPSDAVRFPHERARVETLRGYLPSLAIQVLRARWIAETERDLAKGLGGVGTNVTTSQF